MLVVRLRALISIAAALMISASAHAAGIQPYTLKDLGPEPEAFLAPDFPILPRFDGQGGV